MNQYKKVGSFDRPKRFIWFMGVVLLLLTVGLALASGGINEPRHVTTAAGSQVSLGTLSLSSALGQPVAGSVGAGDLVGASGFWVGAGVLAQPPGHAIFLPFVTR